MGGNRFPIPLGEHLFRRLALRGKPRVARPTAARIAVPLPPIHAVKPGLVPESFEYGSISALLFGKVDDGAPRLVPDPGAPLWRRGCF